MQLGLKMSNTPKELTFLRSKSISSFCSSALICHDDLVTVGLHGAAELRDMQLSSKQKVEVPGFVYAPIMTTKDYIQCRTLDEDQFKYFHCSIGEPLEELIRPKGYEGDKTIQVYKKALTDTRVFFRKRLDNSHTQVSLVKEEAARYLKIDNQSVYYSREKHNGVSKFDYEIDSEKAVFVWHTGDLEKPTAITADESGLIYVATGEKKKSLVLLSQQGIGLN